MPPVSLVRMPTSVELLPEVVSLDPGASAERAGVRVGDRIVSVNGVVPRDILEWVRLVDEETIDVTVVRHGEEIDLEVVRTPGESFGAGISSAVFDRVQTCDNHCEFCFIYQLPKGMRRSLYLKDDDYRLSFLFGNFTTLTRFTEADAERVVSERLSPLHVSVHAAAPHARAEMLRNDRGGFSLRWAKVLTQHGISVKAQIVLCPGVNDGAALDDTLARLLEEMPSIESVAVVPLGLSRHNTEDRMRVHTADEARRAVEQVRSWAQIWIDVTGRRVVHAADELYLVAGIEIPPAVEYGDFSMLEDGIGLVRSFLDDFSSPEPVERERDGGFFASVDRTAYVRAANPAAETGLRPIGNVTPVTISRSSSRRRDRSKPVTILTGTYAAPVIRHALSSGGYQSVSVEAIDNRHFAGNTAVAGLMTGADISAHLDGRTDDRVYVIPDVCLNEGRFLDDVHLDDIARHHDVVAIPPTGGALRRFLAALNGAAPDYSLVSHVD